MRLVEGIPATSPARTVFDVAGVLHPGRTERRLHDALARGVTTVQALRAVTDDLAGRGRPGSALMRRPLEDRNETYVRPESGPEARFPAILRRRRPSLRCARSTGRLLAGTADFVYRRPDAGDRDRQRRTPHLRHRPDEVVRLRKAS